MFKLSKEYVVDRNHNQPLNDDKTHNHPHFSPPQIPCHDCTIPLLTYGGGSLSTLVKPVSHS